MRRTLLCTALCLASPALWATSPPRPGESPRFPPFSLEGPGEHILFSSFVVSVGPFLSSATSSEGGDSPAEQQAREDAAAFVASDGAYRTAALEAELKRQGASNGNERAVALRLLAGSPP